MTKTNNFYRENIYTEAFSANNAFLKWEDKHPWIIPAVTMVLVGLMAFNLLSKEENNQKATNLNAKKFVETTTATPVSDLR